MRLLSFTLFLGLSTLSACSQDRGISAEDLEPTFARCKAEIERAAGQDFKANRVTYRGSGQVQVDESDNVTMDLEVDLHFELTGKTLYKSARCVFSGWRDRLTLTLLDR
ncbi:MAG: hypothetical protein ABWY06_25030 [Pseudomonas sp.]|uniref:hypothetical protein n=1 Tax=Pseudomonas sp. TaxID=306 RepID=UPI003396412E